MKKLIAIGACFLIAIAGCTSPFVYNRLDTLVAWYLEGLVTLNKTQRRDLRAWLGETLDWHRDTELTRYAQFVRTLSQDAAAKVQPATFERAERQFQSFTSELAARSAPEAARLLLDLSDSQVEELIGSLEEKAEERLEEEQKLIEKGRWHERRAKQITKQFRRWVGRATSQQQQLIQNTAEKLQPSYPEWLESQRAWRTALLKALEKRREDADKAAAEAVALLTDPDRYWTSAYRSKQQSNRAHTMDLLIALDATLTEEQRTELQQRLLKFAEQLESLARGQESPS